MWDSPRLYESLFLLAHDRAGRQQVHPRALRAGLAAAILADLALAGHLTVAADRLQPVSEPPVGEAILDQVYATLLGADEGHSARFWIETLAEDIYEPVLDHLLGAGMVRTEEGRRFGLLRVTRYPPADPDVIDKLQARLRFELRGEREVTPYTSAACSLVRTLHLWPKVHLEPVTAADVDRFMAASDATAAHILAASDAAVTDTAVGMYR